MIPMTHMARLRGRDKTTVLRPTVQSHLISKLHPSKRPSLLRACSGLVQPTYNQVRVMSFQRVRATFLLPRRAPLQERLRRFMALHHQLLLEPDDNYCPTGLGDTN